MVPEVINTHRARTLCAKPLSGTLFVEDELERIAKDVVDCAMKIHIALGPGLLESVYTVILQRKLELRGYAVRRQTPIPIDFDGLKFPMAFRADLVVNDCFIIELKSVETLAAVHFKQLLTYLRLTDCRLGLLINFGEALLKDGIRRVVN